MYRKLYKSYINSEILILQTLLGHGKEVKYSNRLQGYGLNDSAFDTSASCTRRMFSYRKNDLLGKKLIIRLKFKGKKEKHYGITPLGIVQLLNNTKIDVNQIRKIFMILLFFKNYYHGKVIGDGLKLFNRLLVKLEKNVISQCMNNTFKKLKIENEKNFTTIYFLENLPINDILIRFRYMIEKNQIYRDHHIVNPTNKKKTKKIEDLEFCHGIATILIDTFHLELYEKSGKEKIPKFYHDTMYEHLKSIQYSLPKALQVEANEMRDEVASIENEFYSFFKHPFSGYS